MERYGAVVDGWWLICSRGMNGISGLSGVDLLAYFLARQLVSLSEVALDLAVAHLVVECELILLLKSVKLYKTGPWKCLVAQSCK